MWSCLVEARHIGIEDAVELLLMQDEQMIEALTPHTAQEPLTDGIGAWGVQPLNIVDNSTSPRQTHFGWSFVSRRSGPVTSSRSEAPSEFFS